MKMITFIHISYKMVVLFKGEKKMTKLFDEEIADRIANSDDAYDAKRDNGDYEVKEPEKIDYWQYIIKNEEHKKLNWGQLLELINKIALENIIDTSDKKLFIDMLMCRAYSMGMEYAIGIIPK